MTYDPKTKSLRVQPEHMDHAYSRLMLAMRHIREASGLPLDRYDDSTALSSADHAQKAILDALEAMGMEIPAKWGHLIDLRNLR